MQKLNSFGNNWLKSLFRVEFPSIAGPVKACNYKRVRRRVASANGNRVLGTNGEAYGNIFTEIKTIGSTV